MLGPLVLTLHNLTLPMPLSTLLVHCSRPIDGGVALQHVPTSRREGNMPTLDFCVNNLHKMAPFSPTTTLLCLALIQFVYFNLKVIDMDIHGQFNHTYHGKPIIKSESYMPWDRHNACASHYVHFGAFWTHLSFIERALKAFYPNVSNFPLHPRCGVRATLHT